MIICQATKPQKAKFRNNFCLLLIYLKLVIGDVELRRMGLGRFIPVKRDPDDSNSLITSKNRDKSSWEVNTDGLNESEK